MTRDPAASASRVARLHQSRGLVAPADALHLARGCARCGAVALDARAMHAWLAPDGATPVAAVDDLHALLGDLAGAVPDAPCACGAPTTTLARYYHAMGRGDLVVERRGDVASLAVMYADGGEAAVASPIEDVFGRPLTTRAAWRAALGAVGAARVAVEPGHWLLAADAPADLAPPDAAAVVGLDAEALRSPAWGWLLEELSRGLHAGRCIALAVDRGALFDGLARALARAGVTLQGDVAAPRWRATRGEVGRSVEVDATLRAFAVDDAPLTAFTLRAAADLDASLDATERYVAAARSLRPAAPLVVDGDRLVGPGGRSIDLTAAPFEGDLDDAGRERDLRVLLDEAPPWAHRSRVCPCGAARLIVSRLVPRATLAAWQDAGRGPIVRRVFEEAAVVRAVEVASLECDRHREPLTRAELDAWGWRDAALDARIAGDAEEVAFRARVALQRDRAGRAVLLAQGPELGSVALRDDWMRALADLADAPVDLAWAQATSPHAVVAWEADADPAVVASVRSVDAMLDPTGRRDPDPLTPPRPLRPAPPRGRFGRLDTP